MSQRKGRLLIAGNGKDGKSPYQVAVEEGFPGTPDEFYEMMGNIGKIDVTRYYVDAQDLQMLADAKAYTDEQINKNPNKEYIDNADKETLKSAKDYVDGKNYITLDQIPKNVSAFTNDADYITVDSVTEKDAAVLKASKQYFDNNVPTNISELINDSKYQNDFEVTTKDQQVLVDAKKYVDDTIAALPDPEMTNYYTKEQTEQAITNKGYITSAQIPTYDRLSQFENDRGFITKDVWDLKYYTTTEDLENNYALKSSLPTNISQLVNDSKFVTETTTNLRFYYTKSETYTQEEVNNLVDAIKSFEIRIANTYEEILEPNILYLLKVKGSEFNEYEEYLFINGHRECIGTTKVDLADYYKKSETYNRNEIHTYVNTRGFITSEEANLSNYYNRGDIDTKLLAKADKTAIPTKLSQLTNDDNYAKVADIPTDLGDLTNNKAHYVTEDKVTEVVTAEINKKPAIYSGTEAPTEALGKPGDIYIQYQ